MTVSTFLSNAALASLKPYMASNNLPAMSTTLRVLTTCFHQMRPGDVQERDHHFTTPVFFHFSHGSLTTRTAASSESVAANADAASCGPSVVTRFVSCTTKRLRSSRRDSSPLFTSTQSTEIGGFARHRFHVLFRCVLKTFRCLFCALRQ